MKKTSLKLLYVFCAIFPILAKAENFESLRTETDNAKREKLQDLMQGIIDKISKKEFDDFDNDPGRTTVNPVLKFYDSSLEYLLNDIPATEVKPGSAVVWYLYNMGFVIKTPTVCFGVDIHHRNAVKLDKLLDFVSVTHNHSDHYSMPLLNRMNSMRKPIISNFFPDFAYTKAAEFTHNIKGVTIHCSEADHNSYLKKFTMPMEFVCPTGDRQFVFFTGGDCFSHEFLNRKSDHIDLCVLHPRCGMSPVEAVKKLNPELTFIGHLQEMAHDVNNFRWEFSVGRHEVNELKKINKKACVPVWGEKFTFFPE